MEPSDLKRGLKFSDPSENVYVRNRDNWRWVPAEVVITNVRRYGELPEETIVYYRDNGGNKWKADATWFLEKYGQFPITASKFPHLEISLRLLTTI